MARRISLPALAAALLGAAFAQSEAPLRLVLTQSLVTTIKEDGKDVERLVSSPKSVRPGDVLTQDIAVSNLVDRSLRNIRVPVPVPANTVYVGSATESANRFETQFSADGGKTFARAPLRKTVTVTENGKAVTKEVVIAPSEYTNVRWVIPELKKDESLKLGFRVKVK